MKKPLLLPISGVWLTLILGVGMLTTSAKALTFDHSISTSLPPEKLWQLLKDALEGHSENGFWPTQYSTISGQVEELGTVTEEVFGTSTVTYRLSHVIAGQRLTYTPLPGEAMEGESHIEITPMTSQQTPTSSSNDVGSTLHWYGTYKVSRFSPVGLTIRVYEQLFFRALKKNLAKIATHS